MADSSFDVVSKLDRQEVDNAVNQTAKEIANRYDFRGVDAAEVVAVGDLLGGLVDSVVDLLAVELGDNVEGGVCHGCTFRWNCANCRSDWRSVSF